MGIELDEVKLTFCEWLDLKDHQVIDLVLGFIVANEFQGPDPLNFYLVGPPSFGKTEILRSLSGYPKIYTISTLTPQTLISGIKGAKGSLLLNLKSDGKTLLVIKDFTTILEMRSEARQEILSQLREITDGYFSKDFGTGKRIQWEGKLAVLAGVTPVLDKHHGLHQILGERFLYYRMGSDDPKRMAEKAQKLTGKEKAMRQELQEVTKQFLDQFKEPKIENIRINELMNEKLINLACFVAQARTGVSRDRYDRTIEYIPEAEGPARLIKQLWVLGCGIATIQGKNEVDEGIYTILKKVGRDSLPKHRDMIFRTMLERGILQDKWENSKTIGRLLNIPTETAKRYCEDLMMVNLLERRIEGEEEDEEGWKHSKAPYLWQLSALCLDLIGKSEVYQLENQGDYDEHFDFKESPYSAIS